jgi:L-ribulose-5-phosphate 3-epimerase
LGRELAQYSGDRATGQEPEPAVGHLHAGFLPHEETDPAFGKLLGRIRAVADLFAAQGIELGLETGQETAETLRLFLQKLDRPNVGVNFDPANMILYDKGDPIQALQLLRPWLKQCHIKDANRTECPALGAMKWWWELGK